MSTTTKSPHLPADFGLTGLGLIMQLVGGVFLSMSLLVLVLALITGGRLLGSSSGAGSMILVVGLCAMRSSAQFVMGRRIVERPSSARKSLQTYALVGGVHTVLLLLLAGSTLSQVGFGVGALLPILLAWPITTVVIARRPALRDAFEVDDYGLPLTNMRPEDGGVMGVAALMSIMGIVGVVLGVVMLVLGLAVLGSGGLTGVLVAALTVALFLRGLAHLVAGVSSLQNPTPPTFSKGVGRYFGMAVLSVLLLGCLGLISAGRGGLPMILMLMAVCSALMVWPAILRSLASMISFRAFEADLDSDDDHVFEATAAPDNGLTTLGYAFLGYSVVSLASVIGAFFGLGGISEMFGGASNAAPSWLSILHYALLFWAGLEFVMMSSRYKLAGYFVVAIGLILALFQLYLVMGINLPSGGGILPGMGAGLSVMIWAAPMVTLAIPLVTGYVLFKPLPEPTGLELAKTFE